MNLSRAPDYLRARKTLFVNSSMNSWISPDHFQVVDCWYEATSGHGYFRHVDDPGIQVRDAFSVAPMRRFCYSDRQQFNTVKMLRGNGIIRYGLGSDEFENPAKSKEHQALSTYVLR